MRIRGCVLVWHLVGVDDYFLAFRGSWSSRVTESRGATNQQCIKAFVGPYTVYSYCEFRGAKVLNNTVFSL